MLSGLETEMRPLSLVEVDKVKMLPGEGITLDKICDTGMPQNDLDRK